MIHGRGKRPIRYLRKSSQDREARGKGGMLEALPTIASNLTGIQVTERNALTFTAAFACVNVIATDLASLPLQLYRRRKSGGRDQVTDHAAADLVAWNPDGNDEAGAMPWKQALIGHTLGWGNGYAEIEWNGWGEPTKLALRSPATTEAKRRDSDKGLYYKLEDGRTVDPWNMIHFSGFGYNGITGYSPIKLARQAIALGLAAESFGAALFGNRAHAGGFLKYPGKLKPEAKKNLRESFGNLHGSVYNAHRVGVLEEGVEWVKTSIDPEDAQFLATRAFQVVEVCRIYRVPPHKIGDYSQAHLANVESSNLDYLVTTLRPWAIALEDVFTRRLLTSQERRKGFFFENLLSALLRGDMKARSDYYRAMRDLGAICPNEIRSQESLNPIPGGDLYVIPANYIPLEMAGKLVLPQTNPQPTSPAADPQTVDDPQSDVVAGDDTQDDDGGTLPDQPGDVIDGN